MDKKNKHNGKMLGWSVFLMLLAVGLLVFFMILFNGKEAKESSNKQNVETKALYCDAENPDNAFFSTGLVNVAKNVLKIIFHDEFPSKISYNYYGEYSNDDAAENASASLHADYNIYMGEHNADAESLYPTFVSTGPNLKINLYVDVNKLDPATGVLFFLDGEQSATFAQNDIEKITELYEAKGFNCVMQNN